MLISQAHAATDAAAHAAPWYADTSLWVSVAFVTFFVVFGKKLVGAVGGMLDDRARRSATTSKKPPACVKKRRNCWPLTKRSSTKP